MTKDPDHQRHPLISGTFNPEDAVSVLLELLEHKINFHRRKIWSHSERFGQNDPSSEQRIAELKSTKAALSALIGDAARRGANLTIRCDIDIALTET